MEYINCVVDTKPMADELKTVSRCVTGTTTAVVAMQTAVIKADQDAADQVCEDVNRGFHALMSSQISQKIAKLQSEVDSHLLRLNQQTKQLLNIKKQMEKDYMRASARYRKTFSLLNSELRQRVQELDQPVFRFAETEVETTNNRMSMLAAAVPVGQLESVTEAQKIITSNVKRNSLKVLEATRSFVSSMEEQKALTNRILLTDRKGESYVLYTPVVVAEGRYEQGVAASAYCSSELFSEQNVSDIRSEVVQAVAGMDWRLAGREASVDNELVRLMEETTVPERVKKTISTLINAADKYQTL